MKNGVEGFQMRKSVSLKKRRQNWSIRNQREKTSEGKNDVFLSRKGKQRGKFHFIWIRSHKEDDKLYE